MTNLSTQPTAQNIQVVQEKLMTSLQYITKNTVGLTESQYRWKPSKGEWSLIEVLAHLRACADINQFKIYAMLAVDEPTIPAIHPRLEWQKIVPYTHITYANSLAAFSFQRQELSVALKALDSDGWKRTGKWDNRIYSIYLVVRSMALHEEEHFQQIIKLREELRKIYHNL